jgi:3-methyladenine DNA glycosylase Tag
MEDFVRMNTEDRVFTFKYKEGKKPKDTMVDPRLVDGKNKLFAIQDGASCLWFLQYEYGILPEFLRNKKFTRFDTLKQTVESYYGSRGYEVLLNAPDAKVQSSNA